MKRILFLAACFLMIGCNRKTDYEKVFNDPNLYCSTVHELNTIVMGNNFSPMVASRNYLYAAIAGYEVMVVAHPEKYNSLYGQLQGLKTLPKPVPGQNINYNLSALLAYCKLGEAVTFPAGSMKYWVDSLKQLARDHGMPADELENSVAFSDTVSSVIMEWSKHDNYLQTRGASEYNVNDSPGRWIPTPPALFFGSRTTLAGNSGSRFRQCKPVYARSSLSV